MSDNTAEEVIIKWNPSTVDTSNAGADTFKGTVEGYEKQVTLTLQIDDL